MSGGVGHWDEVEPRVIAGEHLHGVRGRLGPVMGADRTGLSRYDLGPGERPMPLHAHAEEEEIAFVLRGSGLVTDGKRAWRVAANDTVVWPAGGRPHTYAAGEDGMSLLIFGTGSDAHLTWVPRAQSMWAGTSWIPLDGPNPFAGEDAAGPLVFPLPEDEPHPNVVALSDAPVVERVFSDVVATRRRVGAAAGARRGGLTHATVAPGAASSVPHMHSGDEELFVALAGGGELLLHDVEATLVEQHPVSPGSLVARPAGSGIAHSFVAGDAGLVLLCFSRDDPGDTMYLPRSRKLTHRGLGGLTYRVEHLPYADGEPSPS